MKENPTRTEYEAAVRASVRRIQEQLDASPDFRELACAAYVSPYHFHRIFRALVGEFPAELARRLRLERAAWELHRGNLPVTQIVPQSGYATHEAFTKAFHGAFGCAPSGFRRGERDCAGIRSECSVHFAGAGFTALVFRYHQKGGLNMELETVDLPQRRIAALMHIGRYQEIGRTFGRLAQIAAPLGLYAGRDPFPYQVTIYSGDPDDLPAEELRSIAGVYMAEDAEIGPLEEVRQPAGKYLRAQHRGHYASLGQAWETLYGERIPSGSYALREGPCFEVYVSADHSAPRNSCERTSMCPYSNGTARPANLLTGRAVL